MHVGVLFAVVLPLVVGSLGVGAERVLMLPIQLRTNVYGHLAVARVLERRGNDVFMAVPDQFPWRAASDHSGVELISYRQRDNATFYDRRYFRLLADDVNRARDFRSAPRRADDYRAAVVAKMCGWMMDDEEFLGELKFMNFDVAVVDAPTSAPCHVIVPYTLVIPFVGVSHVYPPLAELAHFPSFVPDLSSEYSDRMTFWQRLDNVQLRRRRPGYPPFGASGDAALLRRRRRRRPVGGRKSGPGSWREVLAESSLFITLRDHVLEWPMPSMPNHVLLPGITQEPGKGLPGELDRYLSSSDRGVILVAFGSLYDCLDRDLVRRLFEAFQREEFRGFRVLLKMDPEHQIDILDRSEVIPNNVWTVTWLPQNDVLAHPKTKLFISHCGNNGQYEALYHGVPMIGLPLYPEQNHNCVRMHKKGFGICMDTWTFTADVLVNNFKLLLNGRAFREQIQNVSAILKHGQLPSETAAFWIEHIAKHGGYHLQSSARDLSYYQLWMIDIWLFYAMFTLFTVMIIGLIIFFGVAFVKNKSKME